jgi:hypothetical protein
LLIADVGLLIDFRLRIAGLAGPKQVTQLGQGRPDVDQAETRDGAPGEVIRQDRR